MQSSLDIDVHGYKDPVLQRKQKTTAGGKIVDICNFFNPNIWPFFFF